MLKKLLTSIVLPLALICIASGCAGVSAHRAEDQGKPLPAASVRPAVADEPLPIPMLDLHGGPEEIGRQHGTQLSAQINQLFDKYLNVRLHDPTRRFVAMQLSKAFETFIDPAHVSEIRAMADGAGIDPSTALLAQCYLDLMPSIACSTVALPGEAASDGIARMGRNLDFPSLNIADKTSVVLVYHFDRADGRYSFASIGWPGMIGVLSGMNEHGLTLANMEVTRTRRYPAAMPYTLLYRTVLERCRSVDEAVAFITASGRQSENNIMLMDAQGNRAVVEITPQKVSVRRGQDGQALISTNHHRGAADGDSPGRCPRYDLLHDVSARDFGKIDVDQIKHMLNEVSQGRMTIQSMIFEPSARIVYLATGARAARQKFHRIDLKRHFDASAR